MTVTSEQMPDTAHTIVVRDQLGPLEFVGEEVADLSWSYATAADYGHDRWTDITLYRVRQPQSDFQYAIQVVGRSVLYHRVDGPCRRGMRKTVGSLKQNAERFAALRICETCQPDDLDDMQNGQTVAVEEDLPTLHRCRSAADVVSTLYERIQKERNRAGLSMKLLQVAADADPAIAAEVRKARSL